MSVQATPMQDKGNLSGSIPMAYGKNSSVPNLVTPPGLFTAGKLPEGVEDIDDLAMKSAKFDPTYAASIHAHKREVEIKYIISRPFLGNGGMQPEINANMRVTLLDWLVKLAEEMNLSCGTYALTIHLIDQALSKVSVKRSQFQLLGCACLLLASKLEELQPPLVADLVASSDYCFDNEELINYEQRMLEVFDLRPNLPTRYSFTQRYCRAGECSDRERCLAAYLTELSLYKVEFCALNMSKVAAAAVHLALQILRPRGAYTEEEGEAEQRLLREQEEGGLLSRVTQKRYIWTKSLEYYTGYQEWELVDTVLKLREAHFYVEDTTLTQGIMYRYSREAHHGASCVGALRLQDVTWDTVRAWTAYKEHPLSYGYQARHGGNGNKFSSAVKSRGDISTSTSTCNLRSHAPAVHSSALEQGHQHTQEPKANLASATNSVSDVGELMREIPARADADPKGRGGEVGEPEVMSSRAPALMPSRTSGIPPGQANRVMTSASAAQQMQQRRSVQSTLVRLPAQATSKSMQGGCNPSSQGQGPGQGTNRAKIDALRSLSTATRRPGPAKRGNASITKPTDGNQLAMDKAQLSHHPSTLSNTSTSFGASGGAQPEEAQAYSSQARGGVAPRASRGAGQALSTLHDIMRSGSGAADASTTSSTGATTTSTAASTSSSDGRHGLHVSRNSAFHPAATMKRAGFVDDHSKRNGSTENSGNAGVALPPTKRRRSSQTSAPPPARAFACVNK